MTETKDNQKPRLLVFASGTKSGGGSGFRKLVEATNTEILKANIVGVVSNHENGGVRRIADELGVKFYHFTGPFDGKHYEKLLDKSDAEWVSLSGWLKKVRVRRLGTWGSILRFFGSNKGLFPNKTINIHPGPLPFTAGTYGRFTHEKVIKEYRRGSSLESFGGLTHSEVTMHFVTNKYDEGPIFFRCEVEIRPTWTAEDLAAAVNKKEHEWQAKITNRVICGNICWDGINRGSLRGYHEILAE